MEPRIIRTPEDHTEACAQIDRLIALDPEPGTKDAELLDVWVVLVETYEREHFSLELPDPIEAIRTRMQDLNLKQRDLVPYIGSASKVSEVLNRRRPLTLPMIKALNRHLGLPATVLLQDSPTDEAGLESGNYPRIPLSELVKRGWLDATIEELRHKSEELTRKFFAPLGDALQVVPLYRRTINERSGRSSDEGALLAWTARILMKAQIERPARTFEREAIDTDFLSSIAKISALQNGPQEVKQYCSQAGIALVVEPHLKRTYLDGATLLAPEGYPVIALTLRYDRLDNFWFTLMHELAHVVLHLRNEDDAFYDDIEADIEQDNREVEADKLARDTLIPRQIWRRSRAYRERTPEAIVMLARELNIHSAIVAGRLRRETKNYQLFNNLVGNHQVRCAFPEVEWT